MSVLDKYRGTELKDPGFLLDNSTGYRIEQDGSIMRIGAVLDDHTGYIISEDGEILKLGAVFDESTGYKIGGDGRIFEINGELLMFDRDTGLRVGADGSLNERSQFGESRVPWNQLQDAGNASTRPDVAEADWVAPAASESSESNYSAPLTTEDLRGRERRQRKTYAKALVVVCIATFWVVFLGGYKFIALLIVAPLDLKVFVDMPTFEPIQSISIDKPDGSAKARWLRFVAGCAPFALLTYLLVMH